MTALLNAGRKLSMLERHPWAGFDRIRTVQRIPGRRQWRSPPGHRDQRFHCAVESGGCTRISGRHNDCPRQLMLD